MRFAEHVALPEAPSARSLPALGSDERDPYVKRRARLVAGLRLGVRDECVLKAVGEVQRHRFVPAAHLERAYDDVALPIGDGEHLAAPSLVARVLEEARVRPGDRLLDVGTGLGYSAAVAAQLGARVLSIDTRRQLADGAFKRLHTLGLDVAVLVGDGLAGVPYEAPFDAIAVFAPCPRVPEALKLQLARGGRLVLPVGTAERPVLVRLTRTPSGFFEERLGPYRAFATLPEALEARPSPPLLD